MVSSAVTCEKYQQTKLLRVNVLFNWFPCLSLSCVLSGRFKLNFGKPKKKAVGTASPQAPIPIKSPQSAIISASLGGHGAHITSGMTADDMTVLSSSATATCSVHSGVRTMSEGKYHLSIFIVCMCMYASR